MLRRFLTDGEQRLLLQAARSEATPLAQRDWHWMRLLIETGMRVNELATLTRTQAELALAHGWLVVPKGVRKGKRRGHEYLVTAPVRACLEGLLTLHRELAPMGWTGAGDSAPLLWGRCRLAARGVREVLGREVLVAEHISVRSLQDRMKRWLERAGLPPEVSPHWMRHTRGVNIIRRSRAENPLKVAQQALGHVSISSTGVYTGMLRDDYERDLHGVAGTRLPKAQARLLAAPVAALAAMAGGV